MLVLFLLMCVVHLFCCYFQITKVQRITKVFLIPLLIVYVVVNVQEVSVFLILALVFGFLGDAFLLFEKNPIYFMCGLGTFLLGHVFYIVELLNDVNPLNYLVITMGVVVVLAVIGLFMFKTLSAHLGDLKIAVIAYCFTILSMLGVAILFFLTQCTLASGLALIGAICFVVSDYLLARSIFLTPFKHKDVWIMATYLLAQLLLVLALS